MLTDKVPPASPWLFKEQCTGSSQEFYLNVNLVNSNIQCTYTVLTGSDAAYTVFNKASLPYHGNNTFIYIPVFIVHTFVQFCAYKHTVMCWSAQLEV